LGAFLLLAPSPAHSQEFRATLSGTVTDLSGAAIPGASITAVNLATQSKSATVSSQEGNYVIPFLQPGQYSLKVEHAGFQVLERSPLELRVNDRLRLDVQLQVGELTERVTVTAEGPLVEAADASLGSVVDSRRIAELPVPHGNPYALIQLSSGVTFAGNPQRDRPYDYYATQYAIGGARADMNELTIDGSPASATYNKNQVVPSEGPPADIVSEFKVQTATFDASVGQTMGGAVNISLKSGTNQLHGAGYFYKMAPDWNANDFFANKAGRPVTDFFYSRWGASASGPVMLPKIYNGRNRTFFLWGYEGIHESRPRGSTTTVPTEKEKASDFSDLLQVGSNYQIYDPNTRTLLSNGRIQSQPFAGNILPNSRLSPIAQKILSYYPAANTAGTVDGGNNYTYPNQPENVIYYTHIWRLDHNINDRQRIFGRSNLSRRVSDYDNWSHNIMTGQWFKFFTRSANLDDVYTITPTLISNLRFAYTRFIRTYDGHPDSVSFDLSSLGLPASYTNLIPKAVSRFPYVTISGFASSYNGILFRPTETYSWGGSLQKVAGNHGLKFGAEYRVYRENQYNIDHLSTGEFDFGNGWTQGPLDNSTAAPRGQALAGMLLGLPTGGAVDRRASYAEQSTVWSLYAQDDWKVTRHLTVNLGVRYELEGPLTERFNRSILGIDPSAALPFEAQVKAAYAANPTPEVPASQFNVRGGLTFAGVNGLPRGLYNRDTNNVMPRLGVAYQISNRTVFRAGYGISFGFMGARRSDVIQNGFTQRTNLVPSLDNGLTFRATLANPYPEGILNPTGSSLGAMQDVGNSITPINQNMVAPRLQHWQVSLQRELPGRMALEVGYIGSYGDDIETTRSLTPFALQYLSASPFRDQKNIDYWTTPLPNPFYPLLPGTGKSGTTLQRASLVRPYPQFTGVSLNTYEGNSWYNALELKLEKRFSRGFTFQAAYTWSKFLEATGFLNEADPKPERAISDQDFPHRASLSGIYEFPFGRGKKFAPSAGPIAARIIGGWQLQGMYVYQSGGAIGLGNILFLGDIHDIPLSGRDPNKWFNTAAGFNRVSTDQLSYNLRTFPSRLSGLRMDGMNNFDISVLKETKILESIRTQFRAEFLNTLNHPMFNPPDASPTSTSFGVVSSQKNFARRIQLGLKVVF
jgi:hypothetical protein